MKINFAFSSVGHLNGYQQQMEELHCQVCDVHVGSRAQMQQHLDGARHQKKINPVQMFKCYLCHIEVTSQSTLNIHMMGKDHLKREKERAKQRKKRGDYNANDKDKVGPMEMSKLKEDTEEENKRLRLEVKNLRAKLVEYQDKQRKCVREHGNMEDFRKYKDYYLDNHIRPEELARGGLYVPKLNY